MIRGNGFKYILTGTLLSMLALQAWAAPPCRTAVEEPDFAFAAGCLIRHGDRLLMVRQLYGGKLGVPAGHAESGESAQCAAHRETWEESGMNVIVHGMLRRFRNGFALYECELTDAAATDRTELEVPDSGENEITQVLWVDPRSIDASQWRFPRQFPFILELFDEGY